MATQRAKPQPTDIDRLARRIADNLAAITEDTAVLLALLKDAEREKTALEIGQAAWVETGRKAEAERDAARLALEPLERAVNESVSGIRKIDIPEWGRLLVAAQAALESKA